jgi:spore maturation protein CgeB
MKILQVALGNQFDIKKALKTLGEVIYFDWSGHNRQMFNSRLLTLVRESNPNIIFLQIQTPGIIDVSTAIEISKNALVINWTGDVRYPCPTWYKEIGKNIGITLFTNMNDVEELRREGIKADYLQIGFPEEIFKPKGKVVYSSPIVFMGNNSGGFPFSKYRVEMVNLLQRRYGKDFSVFGTSWGDGIHYIPDQNEEAAHYRGCKIAINFSHFDYKRYSSDRIFRLMGAGAFCLSHNYQEIEKEFEDGKHLVTWGDFNDLTNSIDYYLEHEEERNVIAREGCEYVHKNCTWFNRIEQLKEIIK